MEEAPNKPALIDFLKESINDMQATIRAIDAKIGFLIALQGILIATWMSIIAQLTRSQTQELHSECWWIWVIDLICVFSILVWLWMIYLTVHGVTNPAKSITGAVEQNGSFFAAGLFDIPLGSAIFLGKLGISKRSFSEHHQSLPFDDDSIIKELCFEQMKLALIRDLKMLRHKISIISSLAMVIVFLLDFFVRFWR